MIAEGQGASMPSVDLRRGLYPAVPVFHRADGRLHGLAQARYVDWIAGQAVGGVAVWSAMGRGLLLSDESRGEVLKSWRNGLGPRQILIAGAGSTTRERHPDRVIESARSMAQTASDGCADAILVHPPTAFRGRAEVDNLTIAYHAAIGDVGLPMIVTYLDEAAGGIAYRPHVLAQLVAKPEVLGLNIATLNSVMTFQDITALMRHLAPATPIVTGETRFLGYSLMAGAEAAIHGMASACTRLQAEFLSAFWAGDATDFLIRNRAIDELARHTFLGPIEGATQRILWCLVHQGVITAEAAHDPWAPRMGGREFEQIGECLRSMGELQSNI